MVWISGSQGQLAPSLVRLLRAVDERYPNRNRASDGSLGDAAHAARSSFHNPLDGYVDALDLTHHAGVFDAHRYADSLIVRKPVWMDHVISNRRIASASQAWIWRPYTGINPHDKHVHFACLRNATGRMSTAPWFLDATSTPVPVPIPGDLMQLAPLSVEKAEEIVGQWYQTFLGRAPGPKDLKYRVPHLTDPAWTFQKAWDLFHIEAAKDPAYKG